MKRKNTIKLITLIWIILATFLMISLYGCSADSIEVEQEQCSCYVENQWETYYFGSTDCNNTKEYINTSIKGNIQGGWKHIWCGDNPDFR